MYGSWMTAAVKYATLLSLSSMYGFNEYYCPFKTVPSDIVCILTVCSKTCVASLFKSPL